MDSSDDDQELELLSQYRPRGGWSPTKPKGKRSDRKGKAKEEPQPPHLSRKGGWIRSRVVLYAVIAALAAIIIWLSLHHFKKAASKSLDGQSPPWYPSPLGGTLKEWNASYTKASKLVARMSLAEKVNVTTGTGWETNLCVGNTAPASDVGFPMLCLQDGPLGIRFADNATLWPAAVTTSATWSKDLMYKRGRALGKEHRLKGVNILLGPSMGPLGRMPGGGRNWEGFGPDPVLAGIAAAETIRGIQDEGVIATAKHYIANEQEHFRQEGGEWGVPNSLSSNIDDRTLHELYLWPFQDSIKAGVASVMCSYNKVNNSYACQNSKLMNGILKDELGFQGFIQSDWLAQRSGVASALAGLDMTMPGDGPNWADYNSFWGPNLSEAVLNGSIPMQRMNDMALRTVAAWYQLEQDNETVWPKPPAGEDAKPNFSSFTNDRIGKLHPVTDDESETVVNMYVNVQGEGEEGESDHRVLAQKIAAEGHVLVKNEDDILPLNVHGLSYDQKPKNDQTIAIGVFGEDAGPVQDAKWPNQCEDRACNEGTLATGWGSGAAEFPFLETPIHALQSSFDKESVTLITSLTNDVKKLPNSMQDMDMCLAFVNSDAGEGFHTWEGINDRKDLHTQKGGDELVKAVADQCKQTMVIVHAVGPVVIEDWIDHPNIKAVILANLPGEKSGFALTDVLLGLEDASGRLPYTVGKSLEDYGPGGQIMFKPTPRDAPQQDFEEGLLIDYRHFDNQSIEPRYEFGYGLSYTTWQLSALRLETIREKSPFPSPRPDLEQPPTLPTSVPDRATVDFPSNFRKLSKYIYPYLEPERDATPGDYPYPDGYNTLQQPSPAGGGEGGNPSLWDEQVAVFVTIRNTGQRKGKQTVQVYVSFPDNVIDAATGGHIEFPTRVLRGFEKVEVRPGGQTDIRIPLTRRDLSYWSVGYQNWVMPTVGQFNISVGTSSRNLPLMVQW